MSGSGGWRRCDLSLWYDPPMKRCRRCGDAYETSSSYCRPCMATYGREWRAANRDRAHMIGRRAYLRGPRFERTTEPHLCTQCGLIKDASEFVNDRSRRSGLHIWCRSCLIPWNYIGSANRRARLRNPNAARIKVADLPSGPCYRCGREDPGGWDHLVALARGGTNTADNLAPCCFTCNRQKWANPA